MPKKENMIDVSMVTNPVYRAFLLSLLLQGATTVNYLRDNPLVGFSSLDNILYLGFLQKDINVKYLTSYSDKSNREQGLVIPPRQVLVNLEFNTKPEEGLVEDFISTLSQAITETLLVLPASSRNKVNRETVNIFLMNFQEALSSSMYLTDDVDAALYSTEVYKTLQKSKSNVYKSLIKTGYAVWQDMLGEASFGNVSSIQANDNLSIISKFLSGQNAVLNSLYNFWLNSIVVSVYNFILSDIIKADCTIKSNSDGVTLSFTTSLESSIIDIVSMVEAIKPYKILYKSFESVNFCKNILELESGSTIINELMYKSGYDYFNEEITSKTSNVTFSLPNILYGGSKYMSKLRYANVSFFIESEANMSNPIIYDLHKVFHQNTNNETSFDLMINPDYSQNDILSILNSMSEVVRDNISLKQYLSTPRVSVRDDRELYAMLNNLMIDFIYKDSYELMSSIFNSTQTALQNFSGNFKTSIPINDTVEKVDNNSSNSLITQIYDIRSRQRVAEEETDIESFYSGDSYELSGMNSLSFLKNFTLHGLDNKGGMRLKALTFGSALKETNNSPAESNVQTTNNYITVNLNGIVDMFTGNQNFMTSVDNCLSVEGRNNIDRINKVLQQISAGENEQDKNVFDELNTVSQSQVEIIYNKVKENFIELLDSSSPTKITDVLNIFTASIPRHFYNNLFSNIYDNIYGFSNVSIKNLILKSSFGKSEDVMQIVEKQNSVINFIEEDVKLKRMECLDVWLGVYLRSIFDQMVAQNLFTIDSSKSKAETALLSVTTEAREKLKAIMSEDGYLLKFENKQAPSDKSRYKQSYEILFENLKNCL